MGLLPAFTVGLACSVTACASPYIGEYTMKDAIVPVVLIERAKLEEELSFLTVVNDAQADGEITPEEATEIIDRQYILWAAASE